MRRQPEEQTGRNSNYNESYKREAVAKAKASGSVSQTARELGISRKSLHAWIRQYGKPLDVDNASRNSQPECVSWNASWQCARDRLRC